MGLTRSLHPTSPITPAQILREGARTCTGPVPALDLGACSARVRLTRHKRWCWMGIVTEDLVATLAVVRTGYAANAFVLVQRRDDQGLAFERSALGGPWTGAVAARFHDDGPVARFGGAGLRVEIVRAGPGGGLHVRAHARGFALEATLDVLAAPPPLSVTAPVGGSAVDTTEKRLLVPVLGEVRIEGRVHALDGLAGYDFTSGLLPRRTRWRWAFGVGHEGGSPFGFNLTSGFVGAAECAAFGDEGPRSLGEPVFTLDPGEPREPWTVRGDDVDLRFVPLGVHVQRTRLGVIRADFVQALGTWNGSVRVGDRTVEVRALRGVAEHQDVTW